MSLKERILTKPGYKILAVIFGIVALFETYNYIEQKEIESIKNSKVEYECNIKGKGWVIIDKSKIVGFTDNGGFIFTNGYANSCRAIKY